MTLYPELIKRSGERGLNLYWIMSHSGMFLIVIILSELYCQAFVILGKMLILTVCGIAMGEIIFSYLLTINTTLKRLSAFQITFSLLKFEKL